MNKKTGNIASGKKRTYMNVPRHCTYMYTVQVNLIGSKYEQVMERNKN